VAGPALNETRLADDLFVWTLGGEEIATSYGANCTAVLGRDAVLLVDPSSLRPTRGSSRRTSTRRRRCRSGTSS